MQTHYHLICSSCHSSYDIPGTCLPSSNYYKLTSSSCPCCMEECDAPLIVRGYKLILNGTNTYAHREQSYLIEDNYRILIWRAMIAIYELNLKS